MTELEKALYEAFYETIEIVGWEAFKSISWFGSNNA